MMAGLIVFALLALFHFSSSESIPSPEFNCSVLVDFEPSVYSYRPTSNLSQIYEALINCPNTTTLGLKNYDYGERRQTDPINFKFVEGDRFPDLRELSLQGYDFGDFRSFQLLNEAPSHDWAKTPMKPMLLEGAKDNYLPPSQVIYISGANIDAWKKAMDWTQLRSLMLTQIDNIFFWKMKGQLPALTNLTIQDNYGRSNVSEYMTDFLTALNPMTNLSTLGYTSSVDWSRVLERHGDTLEHLAITDWNVMLSRDAIQTLSADQLEDISRQCPHLKSFSVNVNIDTRISDESLNALASFANATKLSLWLRGNTETRYFSGTNHSLGYEEDFEPSDGDSESAHTFIDPQNILRIFQDLRFRKKGVELQQLEVRVGDYDIQYNPSRIDSDWHYRYIALPSKHMCSVFNEDGERKQEGEAWCHCDGVCQKRFWW